MPTYRYRAAAPSGGIVRGTLAAASESELERRLEAMRLALVSCTRDGGGGPLRLRRAIDDGALIQFCIHMTQLNRAGVPVLDGLDDIREATDAGRLHTLIGEIRDAVRDGEMLSDALARHPEAFDAVFVSIVRAGEQTGDLAGSFARLEGHLKWVRDLRARIQKATRYPLVLLAALAVVVSVMLGYLAPRLVEFLVLQQMALPLPTVALMATSDFFVAYGPWLLLAFGALALLVLLAARASPRVALWIDGAKLSLPVVGPVITKIALARFTHFFAILFQSGIDVLQCLRTGQEVVANRALNASLARVRREVEDGKAISAALRDAGAFPALVIRMFRVGEDSGRLDEALDNVRYFYEREVDESVGRIIGLIEPVMTGVMGLMLVWIVLAVLGPLYDSFSQLPS